MLAFMMLALSPASALKVLVTGAGGRTGRLVFEQLQQDASMSPVGLVRSRKAEKALRKVGAGDDDIVRGDVTDTNVLAGAMAGCDGVVLCTSAVPQIKPLSIAWSSRLHTVAHYLRCRANTGQLQAIRSRLEAHSAAQPSTSLSSPPGYVLFLVVL